MLAELLPVSETYDVDVNWREGNAADIKTREGSVTAVAAAAVRVRN